MPTIRMTTRSSTRVKPSSREARERSVDSMFPPRETCLYGSPAPRPRRQAGFLRMQRWRPVALRTALADGLPVRLGPDASPIATPVRILEPPGRRWTSFCTAIATLRGCYGSQTRPLDRGAARHRADRGRDRPALAARDGSRLPGAERTRCAGGRPGPGHAAGDGSL